MAYCKHIRANSPFLVAFRSPGGLEAVSFPEQPLSATPALAVEAQEWEDPQSSFRTRLHKR
jgi:hypothetical protein